MAGLPGKRATVGVGPPLLARGANLGVSLNTSLAMGASRKLWTAVPKRLAPRSVIDPPPLMSAGGAVSPARTTAELPATIVLCRDNEPAT